MKIAIAGYGLEGEQNYRYFVEQGHDVTIVDEKEAPDRTLPDDAQTLLGQGAFDQLKDFDMVIRTAGLAPRKIKTDGKIWSATNEFFEKCPAPIIGVTGTKGKGTTSSFIASILKAAGKTVHLVGNIGTPALAALPNIQLGDVVVYELSSFQLWDIEKSPHVAVVLMIEPDHLDVHDDFEDYIQAKANIVRYQTSEDTVVFNQNNKTATAIAESSLAKKVAYPFSIDEFIQSIQLPGLHNQENASAAIAAVSQYVDSPDVIHAGLADFHGLPHRLKLVREVRGVKYYDDSIATTPGSAIAALASFEEPKVIILGGHDKGADYDELINACIRTSSTVIAIGANGDAIQQRCNEWGVTCIRENGDMQNIVDRAHDIASEGSVVILSPAAASFDMFKSYTDRGDQFVAAVRNL